MFRYLYGAVKPIINRKMQLKTLSAIDTNSKGKELYKIT